MSLTKSSYSMITGAPVNVLDFGADNTGAASSSAAFAAAIASATNDEMIVVPAGTYKLTSQLMLGAAGQGARMVGIGKPTLIFNDLGATTDCVLLQGANMRQIEFSNLIVNCNTTGRDGVVLAASDTPYINNLYVLNAVQDGFVISCSGVNYVENAELNLSIQTAGRHGVYMSLAGSNGAFINEILWRQLEIRGVSAITDGANAICMESTASGGGSKFSNQYFLKTNFDAQYVSPNPVPSVNVVEIKSGNAENFVFTSGGWENTGATPLTGGYAWAVSGTGSWGGLTVSAVIWNSYWGNLGPQPEIVQQFIYDFSFSNVKYNVPVNAEQFNASSDVNVGGNSVAYPKININSSNGTAEGGAISFKTLGTIKSGIGKRSAIEGFGTDNSLTIQSYYDDVYINAVNAAKHVYIRNNGNNIADIYATGLTVNGTLAKSSGSFKIDHPLPQLNRTHHLVHSFIEGPQADNLYRGNIKLVNGKAVINLDTAAKMTEGTFAALNRKTQCFVTNQSSWDAVKGTVARNILTIECENSSSSDSVSWMVIGERQDAHIVNAAWTDNDGCVIVEPVKELN